MFGGLSAPALLVAENSQVLALNERAAGLFMMPAEDIVGQRWAGLDANGTLIKWRGTWRALGKGTTVSYRTDIETGNRYMRPIQVEAQRIDENYALLVITDLINPNLPNDELQLVGEELRLGFISYNRVERSYWFSDTCRQMLGLSGEGFNKSTLLSAIEKKMAPEDLQQLVETVDALLANPCQKTETFTIETESGTTDFNFVARSHGNALHVTHLSAIVREYTPARGDLELATWKSLMAYSLERMSDLVLWLRFDGNIAYANQTLLNRLGYQAEDLTGLSVTRIAPDFNAKSVENYFVNLRKVKRISNEYVLSDRQENRVLVKGTAHYIRIGEDEFSCFISRDFQEQKDNTKRQQLMEFTFDQSEDMILWSRPDGSIYDVNATFLTQTGFAETNVRDMTVDSIYAEPIPHELHWEKLRRGEMVTHETKLHVSGKRQIPVLLKMSYINYEGEDLKCVYIYDLSDTREKDRLLSLAQIALDTAADCILWLDNRYRVQYANQTLLDLLPPAVTNHFKGRDVLSLLPGLDRALIQPGGDQNFDLETTDGEVKNMNLTCSLMDYDGHHYYVLSARDISTLAQERRELETAYTEIEVMRDRLRDENVTLREENDTKYNVNNIITVSKKYQKILAQVGQVADVDTTVLITGETGTGKELLARAVHQLSAREDFPLVKVNCATLPENLIESELFGHEKGAFTGAVSRKKGRFEMADRGTIFLDEIGELPLDLQSKLLRVLQEDEFERLGGEHTIKVDVRLVAATNRDLEEMVRAGKFREDLYYRLNVFPIHNLPLRDRPEDIPVLIEYFTKKYAKRQGKVINRINSSDIKRLSGYPFPGNIRELENIIERSVVLCQSDTLSIDFIRPSRVATTSVASFLTFEDMQRKHIIDALKRTGGRVTGRDGAGVLLEVNDRTLVSKMKKLGIKKHEYLR